jgi:S1-C subfamily serine protease
VHVSPGSAGAQANLRAGDLVHFAGGSSLPTPDAIRESFDQSTPERPLLIGVTRGESHLLMVLRK